MITPLLSVSPRLTDEIIMIHLHHSEDPHKLRTDTEMCREENQLDATECFIAIIICSTCFGHSYAHHQELGTILVLLPRMVCNALVAGGRLLGVEQQAMRLG